MTARTITPSRVIVDGVPSSDLGFVYQEAWPFLEKALAHAPQTAETFTKETLLDALLLKRCQLWIAWDGAQGRVIGAVTTQLANYREQPNELCVESTLLGGIRFNEWVDAMMKTVSAWGLERGCSHMVCFGRKGWLKRLGFTKYGIDDQGILVMVKKLKD